MTSLQKYISFLNNLKEEKEEKKEKKELKCKSYLEVATNLQANPNYPTISFNGTQLRSLYNVPNIKGNDIIVAIIIAFSSPKSQLQNDLKKYWQSPSNFGSRSNPPTINIYTMPGSTSSEGKGWDIEAALDVQVIATINPNSKIWIVEAKSSNLNDLRDAASYATETLNADILSCSWGLDDDTLLTDYADIFTDRSNNKCFLVSSGDTITPSWPSVLPNVLSVGGTTLLWTPTIDKPLKRTEFTWNLAGAGYSVSVNKPSYQSLVNTTTSRAIPDVSLVANRSTGINIVCAGKWQTVGGTSTSCPMMAGILSLANQLRVNNNKPKLTTSYSLENPKIQSVQEYLYNSIYLNTSLYRSCFYDIIYGTIGRHSANIKYDTASGLGSPNATNLCNELLNL
jgi:subtilase family serine protease